MGFPILVKWHLYIESGPWLLHHRSHQYWFSGDDIGCMRNEFLSYAWKYFSYLHHTNVEKLCEKMKLSFLYVCKNQYSTMGIFQICNNVHRISYISIYCLICTALWSFFISTAMILWFMNWWVIIRCLKINGIYDFPPFQNILTRMPHVTHMIYMEVSHKRLQLDGFPSNVAIHSMSQVEQMGARPENSEFAGLRWHFSNPPLIAVFFRGRPVYRINGSLFYTGKDLSYLRHLSVEK